MIEDAENNIMEKGIIKSEYCVVYIIITTEDVLLLFFSLLKNAGYKIMGKFR